VSALDLDAIEARANAADAGPWRSTWPDPAPAAHDLNDTIVESLAPGLSYAERMVVGTLWHDGSHAVCSEPNAAFIAAARSDVPALAALARAQAAELATLRARMVPMSDAALDAAVAAEDRAAVDEPLLDGTDGAHPAWWRGHDRAAEVWSERVATAERERDEARADAARLRGFLPPVALVVCPACGGGVEGDLDDDAEYITRLHHRGVSRDGLSLVRCDGGIARESAQ
jgi:hypothetical protein